MSCVYRFSYSHEDRTLLVTWYSDAELLSPPTTAVIDSSSLEPPFYRRNYVPVPSRPTSVM